MNRRLITTALKQTWSDNDSSVSFLGEWCKLYSEKKSWEKMDHCTLPFHWDDRNKLKRDHDYLKAMYEQRLLPVLAKELNAFHKLNEPVQFWRIVLGPWLITYLPIIFDRWEMLRVAFEKEEKYTTSIINDTIPVAQHFGAFLELMQTDTWNFHICQRILIQIYGRRIEALAVSEPLPTVVIADRIPSSKEKLLGIADKMLGMLGGSRGILFYHSYFPPAKLTKLMLALKQLPRFYSDTFSYSYREKPFNPFRSKPVELVAENEFEAFLFAHLYADMPVAYLEEFSALYTRAMQIPLKHHTIVTANAYWANEPFKIWVAKKQQEGAKLLISQHGGSLPPLFDTFQHEEDISDTNITWFKPYHPKHKRLPPNKIDKGNAGITEDGGCSVIGFECPRFSYRATAGAITHQALLFFEQTATFCEKLSPVVKEKLIIRPYPEMGWQTRKRYTDRFGAERIDPHTPYKTFMQSGKLTVCTYPQTTFSEAMASGKPTVLLYVPEYNETLPQAAELVQAMRKANIVFSDAADAAAHVNRIWDNIGEWWNSADTVYARNLFYDTALDVNGDWKKEWVHFLKSADNKWN